MLDAPLISTFFFIIDMWTGVWFMHCHLDVHTSWGLRMAWVVLDGPEPNQKLPPPPSDLPKCWLNSPTVGPEFSLFFFFWMVVFYCPVLAYNYHLFCCVIYLDSKGLSLFFSFFDEIFLDDFFFFFLLVEKERERKEEELICNHCNGCLCQIMGSVWYLPQLP